MMYIYQIPNPERLRLVDVLNVNDFWRDLAGRMRYDEIEIDKFRRAGFQPGNSPADALLVSYGQRNHTTDQLFMHLLKLNHFQALEILKPFVTPRLHEFISHSNAMGPAGTAQLPVGVPMPPKTYFHPTRSGQNICRNVSDNSNSNGIPPQGVQGGNGPMYSELEAANHPDIHVQGTSSNGNVGNFPATYGTVVTEPQVSINNGGSPNARQLSPVAINVGAQDLLGSISNNIIASGLIPVPVHPNQTLVANGGAMASPGSPVRPPQGLPAMGNGSPKLLGPMMNGRNDPDPNIPELPDVDKNSTPNAPDNGSLLKPTMNLTPTMFRKRNESSGIVKKESADLMLRRVTFEEIEKACNNFAPEGILGRGGFGEVYKGRWHLQDVAVKRIRDDKKAVNFETYQKCVNQAITEIQALHISPAENILPLLAYSFSDTLDTDPCLVYQYMPNGSVSDRLNCKNGTPPLSWDQRMNIALGTARGLCYLHSNISGTNQIIHGDIKGANILLDKHLEPKIGDFGLARGGPDEASHRLVSTVSGTASYLPNDYVRTREMCVEVDTYCYGIFLMELITGKPPSYVKDAPKLSKKDENGGKGEKGEKKKSQRNMRDQILDERNIVPWIDPKVGIIEPWPTCLFYLALDCCTQRRQARPTMCLVYTALEKIVIYRDTNALEEYHEARLKVYPNMKHPPPKYSFPPPPQPAQQQQQQQKQRQVYGPPLIVGPGFNQDASESNQENTDPNSDAQKSEDPTTVKNESSFFIYDSSTGSYIQRTNSGPAHETTGSNESDSTSASNLTTETNPTSSNNASDPKSSYMEARMRALGLLAADGDGPGDNSVPNLPDLSALAEDDPLADQRLLSVERSTEQASDLGLFKD